MKIITIVLISSVLMGLSCSLGHAKDGDGTEWELSVRGMSCPLCAKNIDKQLSRVPGVVEVAVDLGDGKVRVRWAIGMQGDKQAMIKAVQDAGFSVAEIREIP